MPLNIVHVERSDVVAAIGPLERTLALFPALYVATLVLSPV